MPELNSADPELPGVPVTHDVPEEGLSVGDRYYRALDGKWRTVTAHDIERRYFRGCRLSVVPVGKVCAYVRKHWLSVGPEDIRPGDRIKLAGACLEQAFTVKDVKDGYVYDSKGTFTNLARPDWVRDIRQSWHAIASVGLRVGDRIRPPNWPLKDAITVEEITEERVRTAIGSFDLNTVRNHWLRDIRVNPQAPVATMPVDPEFPEAPVSRISSTNLCEGDRIFRESTGQWVTLTEAHVRRYRSENTSYPCVVKSDVVKFSNKYWEAVSSAHLRVGDLIRDPNWPVEEAVTVTEITLHEIFTTVGAFPRTATWVRNKRVNVPNSPTPADPEIPNAPRTEGVPYTALRPGDRFYNTDTCKWHTVMSPGSTAKTCCMIPREVVASHMLLYWEPVNYDNLRIGDRVKRTDLPLERADVIVSIDAKGFKTHRDYYEWKVGSAWMRDTRKPAVTPEISTVPSREAPKVTPRDFSLREAAKTLIDQGGNPREVLAALEFCERQKWTSAYHLTETINSQRALRMEQAKDAQCYHGRKAAGCPWCLFVTSRSDGQGPSGAEGAWEAVDFEGDG